MIFEENGEQMESIYLNYKLSTFASCPRPLRTVPKLFAVADIRPRDSSVSAGDGCVNYSDG